MKSVTEKLRDTFIRRMKKEESVERAIVIILLPKRTWESGLSCEKLLELINKEKKCQYEKGRIYEAISLINRFGTIDYHIYIVSRHGWINNGKNKNVEYRYFNVKQPNELVTEKDKLDYRKEIISIKECNVEHQEKIGIPQEEKLAELLQR